VEQIDWSTEWWRSPVWILGVYVLVLVGFALVGWLLIKRTGWGRQFWRLSRMYFIPSSRTWRGFRPILVVALLLLLTVMSVRLDVLLSFQGNELFTALQENDQPAFWRSIIVFAVLATVNVLLVLLTFYVGQAQLINWRLWLNQRMVGDWLTGAAYHRGRFVNAPIDNPDQRIQADITSYASLSQSLALGMVSSMVTLVSFTVILWGLSGPLEIGGITIPRAMVFLAYIYVIIATVIAFRIGRPLIRLNFLNERLTASYRYALVRVRENSENVAFYRGEQVENTGLLSRFSAVIANVWAIVFRSLKFQGFNLVVNQIAVVFPVLIQAPRFFAGTIQLGDVTQTATAFGNVQGALSFFRTAYDDFAGYRAVLNRLTGLLDSNEEARDLPGPVVEPRLSGLGIHDFDVRLPDGRPLVSNLNLELAGGASLLVKGPSGTGKTTLLRSMAGLWPHVSGRLGTSSEGGTLFCSQQPYLPLGTLRTALAYPLPAAGLDDATAQDVLQAVLLGHLIGRLDEEADWSKVLSPGEQQRLSFGRILLTRPALIFLDESTSALDEGMEYAMYSLIRQRLPGVTIVSVGHRSTLDPLHTDELRLVGDGRWEAKALVG
jgi:vitamin B12/bleomycin/antimicrobial peptide transport system ATP-binding/permease protein